MAERKLNLTDLKPAQPRKDRKSVGRGPGSGAIAHCLFFEDSNGCASGAGDARNFLGDHGHRLIHFEMACLNLALRFDNFRQGEGVVTVGA